ncbi:MAG: transaldolase family protein [Spirochaetia bacterium]|jgi:transaldolase
MQVITDEAVLEKIHSFVMEKSANGEKARAFRPEPFWKGLKDLGTALWLDTGDIEAAAKLWTAEFSGLTTNNTLLNKEIQKGTYDGVIKEAGAMLGRMEKEQKVIEIAFLLNALHGQRLVHTFGTHVSVELHTATAHDVAAAVAYGRRFHAIDPDRFIVKVPLTAAGLLATRALRQEGIPVNFTLGFSARQNYLSAVFASPSFVNVFLGRCNAYVSDNALGDGLLVGEKATLASQRAVSEVSRASGKQTLQIAASMRGGGQVADLAGVDVMTIPTATAAEARSSLDGKWRTRLKEEYRVTLGPGVEEKRVRLSVLWDVSSAVKDFARAVAANPPASADELVQSARQHGVGDLFPRLSDDELQQIASDGKVPKHSRWAQKVASGELAIDSLLNLAGLASFTQDQKALDDRIRGLIG